VFFDQRGAGLSPRVNPEEITLASALADLDSIVDYYGEGEKVNLVGHSWGAMLTSAYLGQHPEKVDHAVLAEPGFLTSEFAEKFAEATRIRLTPGVLYHFLKTKFESLHVKGPDDHAADDYFGYQMNILRQAIAVTAVVRKKEVPGDSVRGQRIVFFSRLSIPMGISTLV